MAIETVEDQTEEGHLEIEEIDLQEIHLHEIEEITTVKEVRVLQTEDHHLPTGKLLSRLVCASSISISNAR